MEQEAAVSKTAYFVTLTYRPEDVPYDKYGNKILVQKDLTDFMKRLRHHHCNHYTIEQLAHGLTRMDKIKMFGCGEYGEQFGRPHFHLLIFNASFRDIEKSWTKGIVDCRKSNGKGAAGYIMKYMDKHLGKTQDWKKPKEFTTQSEGIGKHYIEKFGEWHRNNLDVAYVVSPAGAMLPMPRYYRERIYNDEQKLKQMAYIQEMVSLERAIEQKEIGHEAYNANIKSLERVKKAKFDRGNKKRIIE